mmetsp:Transcript_36258/g.81649  ORF Transcript_36258/g.81649 Transcript_36258/m.81649 type:complete len:265 (-) Transcript_36258:175-969(-)
MGEVRYDSGVPSRRISAPFGHAGFRPHGPVLPRHLLPGGGSRKEDAARRVSALRPQARSVGAEAAAGAGDLAGVQGTCGQLQGLEGEAERSLPSRSLPRRSSGAELVGRGIAAGVLFFFVQLHYISGPLLVWRSFSPPPVDKSYVCRAWHVFRMRIPRRKSFVPEDRQVMEEQRRTCLYYLHALAESLLQVKQQRPVGHSPFPPAHLPGLAAVLESDRGRRCQQRGGGGEVREERIPLVEGKESLILQRDPRRRVELLGSDDRS